MILAEDLEDALLRQEKLLSWKRVKTIVQCANMVNRYYNMA